MFKTKENPNKNKIRCLVIRDRESGGINDEWLEKDKVPANIARHTIFGVKMPVLVATNDHNTAFMLPDEVIITPEKVARIPGCEPWQKYKTIIKTLWDNLKPAIPVVVIIADMIFIIMLRG